MNSPVYIKKKDGKELKVKITSEIQQYLQSNVGFITGIDMLTNEKIQVNLNDVSEIRQEKVNHVTEIKPNTMNLSQGVNT